MWDLLKQSWDQGVDIATLVLLAISIAVNAGLLTRRSRTLKDLLYIEQDRDNFRKKYAEATARLEHVDPERFIDRAMELREAGEWDALEKAAFDFSDRQAEAFGLAAEILTEQRILDSDEHGKSAIEDAQRFAAIGQAANPEAARLEELAKLADRRARDIAAGEPIETLNWEGLSDVELNRLSQGLNKDGKYALAEMAARRSVPLARLRTGEISDNYAGALGQHAYTLHALGSYREAETIYNKVLEISRKIIGAAHPDYAHRLNNLAGVMYEQGRVAEAEGLFREALEITRDALGEAHPGYAKHLGNLGSVLGQTDRLAEGRTMLEQALAIFRAALPADHPDIEWAQRHLDALPDP